MMEINGKKTLEYIIERLLSIANPDHIMLSTSTEISDRAICKLAIQSGICCYQGSLENVASRFYESAREREWDFAVRINGDNIFVDIPTLKKMLSIAESNKYDFISNVKNRTFPKGMSIEIVRVEHFRSLLNEINKSGVYQEHVTAYLYDHECNQKYYFLLNSELPEAAGIQLALDTKKDFERMKFIINHFTKPQHEYNMKDILPILKKYKDE